MELADDLAAFGTSARRLLGDVNLSGAIRDGAPDLGARTGALWAQAVALGWTGLMVPEAHGGSGLDAAYLVALATELGRACAAGPFAANLALLPALCLAPSAHAFAAEFLPKVVDGSVIVTLARPDDGPRPSPYARPYNDSETVSPNREIATHFALLRVDNTAGAVRLSLRLIDRTAPGLRVRGNWFDPASAVYAIAVAAEVERDAPGFEITATEAELDDLLLPLRLFRLAESLGAADAALALTIEYARTRQQFGQVIGSLQAIQHKLTDAFIALANARELLQAAVCPQPREATACSAGLSPLAVHAAALKGHAPAIAAAQLAVQLHGAMGFCWEHEAHLFLKRARAAAAGFSGLRGSESFLTSAMLAGEFLPG